MLASLKSEFRKLFTIRSTYVILAMIFLLLSFFTVYAQGIAASDMDLSQPNFMYNIITNTLGFTFVIGTIIVLLLVTHEYRYNTVMYTLTASNSRARSLLAKMLAVTGLSIAMTVFFCALAPALNLLGLKLGGHELGPQTLDFKELIWQCLFTGWGMMMYGFVIAAIVRNQIGAIVLFLMIPTTLEGLLTLLLKNNGQYLPFSALTSVATQSPNLHGGKAALVSLVYIVVGLVVSFVLYIKRDAN